MGLIKDIFIGKGAKRDAIETAKYLTVAIAMYLPMQNNDRHESPSQIVCSAEFHKAGCDPQVLDKAKMIRDKVTVPTSPRF